MTEAGQEESKLKVVRSIKEKEYIAFLFADPDIQTKDELIDWMSKFINDEGMIVQKISSMDVTDEIPEGSESQDDPEFIGAKGAVRGRPVVIGVNTKEKLMIISRKRPFS